MIAYAIVNVSGLEYLTTTIAQMATVFLFVSKSVWAMVLLNLGSLNGYSILKGLGYLLFGQESCKVLSQKATSYAAVKFF